MKLHHILMAMGLAVVVAMPAQADETISLPGAIPSADACEAAWRGADTPEAAAAVFIGALITYETNEGVARECMRRLYDDIYLTNGQLSYDSNYLIDVGIDRHPEIARSYIRGTEPANGYTPPEGPWEIVFTRDARYDLGENHYRVKVYTSGQPTSRPITLRLTPEGTYRVNEASTLFVGVAAPR